MNREKFPEKVPFRLTRMMTKAMEVSGIEGNFRYDCSCIPASSHSRNHDLGFVGYRLVKLLICNICQLQKS